MFSLFWKSYGVICRIIVPQYIGKAGVLGTLLLELYTSLISYNSNINDQRPAESQLSGVHYNKSNLGWVKWAAVCLSKYSQPSPNIISLVQMEKCSPSSLLLSFLYLSESENKSVCCWGFFDLIHFNYIGLFVISKISFCLEK